MGERAQGDERVTVSARIWGTREHVAACLRKMAARVEADPGFRSSSTGGPEGAAWSVEPEEVGRG